MAAAFSMPARSIGALVTVWGQQQAEDELAYFHMSNVVIKDGVGNGKLNLVLCRPGQPIANAPPAIAAAAELPAGSRLAAYDSHLETYAERITLDADVEMREVEAYTFEMRDLGSPSPAPDASNEWVRLALGEEFENMGFPVRTIMGPDGDTPGGEAPFAPEYDDPADTIPAIEVSDTVTWGLEAEVERLLAFTRAAANEIGTERQRGFKPVLTVSRVVEAQVDACPICFLEPQVGDEMGKLECGHSFDRTCLKSWIESTAEPTCPLCRAAIKLVSCDEGRWW